MEAIEFPQSTSRQIHLAGFSQPSNRNGPVHDSLAKLKHSQFGYRILAISY